MRDVEAYDPATGSFSVIGQLAEGRSAPLLTLLADGKVLVSGGVVLNAEQQGVISNTMEVFDPAAGASTAPVPMREARRAHAAIALADGKVLLAGGTTNAGSTASAELFDPASGQTTALEAMTEPRSQSGAIRLVDGSVLIVGGARLENNSVAARLKTAERFAP
jgi:hypothetical protein